MSLRIRISQWSALLATVTALATPALHAESVGVGAKIGTLGAGAELTIAPRPELGFRAGFNTLSWDMDFDYNASSLDTDNVNARFDWQSIMLLADLHPFGGGFRLSGGLLFNNNEVRLRGDPANTFTINDNEYALGSLEGTVGFPSIAPYVGIGYGNVQSEGPWHFALDLGVAFQGSPEVSLSGTALDEGLQPYLDEDLAREAADLEEDAAWLDLYPVIAFGVMYAF